MHPHSQYVQFGVTVEPVYLEHSLNDFAHVSQVEHVVSGRRS